MPLSARPDPLEPEDEGAPRRTGNTLAESNGASTRELMVRMGTRAALSHQHATDERDREIASDMDKRIAKAPRPQKPEKPSPEAGLVARQWPARLIRPEREHPHRGGLGLGPQELCETRWSALSADRLTRSGADDGNRTRVISLKATRRSCPVIPADPDHAVALPIRLRFVPADAGVRRVIRTVS
jgi:hypothetical protein